jgi:hypothetical protein
MSSISLTMCRVVRFTKLSGSEPTEGAAVGGRNIQNALAAEDTVSAASMYLLMRAADSFYESQGWVNNCDVPQEPCLTQGSFWWLMRAIIQRNLVRPRRYASLVHGCANEIARDRLTANVFIFYMCTTAIC